MVRSDTQYRYLHGVQRRTVDLPAKQDIQEAVNARLFY